MLSVDVPSDVPMSPGVTVDSIGFNSVISGKTPHQFRSLALQANGDTQMIGAALSDGEEPARWRKSSFSNSGDCLEWMIDRYEVRLRDSTKPSSGELHVTHAQWNAFLAAVKFGEADLP